MDNASRSAEILLTPPGAVTAEDRQALREVGVVVVETDDPKACQFLRAGQVASSDDMLWAAMDAIRRDFGYGDHGAKQREQMAQNMFALIGAAADQTDGLPGKIRANRKAAAAEQATAKSS